jgi:hypothetical protein
MIICLRFEVLTAVAMKNAVFWDVGPCSYYVNRCFEETYRLHLQGRKIRERGTSVSTWPRWFLARRFFYPEDGGDTFLRNVGLHNIYTAPHSSNHYMLTIDEHIHISFDFM